MWLAHFVPWSMKVIKKDFLVNKVYNAEKTSKCDPFIIQYTWIVKLKP